MNYLGTITYIDKEGLSSSEIANIVLSNVHTDFDYSMYYIDRVKVVGSPTSTRDGDVYTVEIYGETIEDDLDVTIGIGDKVINDLDGKEYIVTGLSPRQSNVRKLIGNNVYLSDENGNTAIVYEWEVTKRGN